MVSPLICIFAFYAHRTPGFVAAYVVRSADQVTASSDNRELTPMALYVPILSGLIIFGLWFSYQKEASLVAEIGEVDDSTATEGTGLLNKKNQPRDHRRSSVVCIEQAFSRQSIVNKRISGQIMGLTAFDTKEEKALAEQMQNDLDEWAQLAEMDDYE